MVLPDSEAGAGAVQMLRPYVSQVVEHASGRPWMLGVWPDELLAVGQVGTARLAVIGRHRVDGEVLSARLKKQAQGISGTDGLAAGVAGCFHVVGSAGGRVHVRGSASGTRRVFHARVAGVTVASSRADLLAAVIGAGVDEEVLALRMAVPGIAHPLEERCIWKGVSGIRPDDCLVLEPDGRARTVRWWTAPEPSAAFEEGAASLRDALSEAVGTCSAGGGIMSADLSGGLDSASLCSLAVQGPARLVTFGWHGADPANDDTVWARRAAEELPDAEHVTAGPGEIPAWFSGLSDLPFITEEPGPWVRDWARILHVLGRMAGRGSRLHLFGGGGDELFTPMPSFLHDLVRSRPLTALSLLRQGHALRRYPLRPVLYALGDHTSLADELARGASRLTATPSLPHAPAMGWGFGTGMPPWATPQAVATVAAMLREAADRAPVPLSPYRSLHMALQCLRAGADAVRQIDQATTEHLGIGYATPFHDDAVIEAALSVRLEERMALACYKPLLVAAMRGAVPEAILARTTKGEYSADFYIDFRRHRGELLALFDAPALADAGLIRPDRLRAALRGYPDHQLHTQLLPTLGCEAWLRSPPKPPTAPPDATTGGFR
ncbi:asparagine synthase-related protein [Streptomyces luteireticuli]|uniref:asparagine synthase-related protein n=1 Tax=Streptomyces luteireticuli TaxID=173858 RepID=UPI00355618B8